MAKKILLVDDDPDLVNAARMILEAKNFEVAAAYGGVEGLQKARTENPDLIVLDVMMPDKDGYAVCKELKSDPQLSRIPVLLLTAVVSHISVGNRPPTYSLSSTATTRIPLFSEILREAMLSTAFGARSTGKPNSSNQ